MCRLTSHHGEQVAPSRAKCALERLPCEATLHLLDYLDASSLSKCAQTHSSLYKLASTTWLWDRLCKLDFGIEGGKTDYASRVVQEKQRALGNLELYLGFLDEIYFSIAVFFSLISAFGVFPLLAVLKEDGWLDISWVQVFASFYGLLLVAVMFVALRVTLLVTMLHPDSSLNRSLKYCGLATVTKYVLLNPHVWHRALRLAMAALFVCAVPFTIQLYADEYLSTPGLPVTITWLLLAFATITADNKIKRFRAKTLRLMTCMLSSTTILFLKTLIVPQLCWVIVVSPIGVLTCRSIYEAYSYPGGSKRHLFRRSGSYFFSPSHPVMHTYYQHHVPILSILLSALKLDGIISLPWVLIMLDYFCWTCVGPLASLARRQIQVMFRDMPIPANLRKL